MPYLARPGAPCLHCWCTLRAAKIGPPGSLGRALRGLLIGARLAQERHGSKLATVHLQPIGPPSRDTPYVPQQFFHGDGCSACLVAAPGPAGEQAVLRSLAGRRGRTASPRSWALPREAPHAPVGLAVMRDWAIPCLVRTTAARRAAARGADRLSAVRRAGGRHRLRGRGVSGRSARHLLCSPQTWACSTQGGSSRPLRWHAADWVCAACCYLGMPIMYLIACRRAWSGFATLRSVGCCRGQRPWYITAAAARTRRRFRRECGSSSCRWHVQPNNAVRTEQLGVGCIVRPGPYRPACVARLLGTIISSTPTAERAREAAQRVQEGPGLAPACEALERLAAGQPVTRPCAVAACL